MLFSKYPFPKTRKLSFEFLLLIYLCKLLFIRINLPPGEEDERHTLIWRLTSDSHLAKTLGGFSCISGIGCNKLVNRNTRKWTWIKLIRDGKAYNGESLSSNRKDPCFSEGTEKQPYCRHLHIILQRNYVLSFVNKSEDNHWNHMKVVLYGNTNI